jgi:hypothetical protein
MADWETEQRPLLADVLLLDPDAPMHLPLSKPSTGRRAAWGPTGTATAKARPLRSSNGVGANLLPGKRGGLALDAFYAGVMCTEAHEFASRPRSKVQRHAPSSPSHRLGLAVRTAISCTAESRWNSWCTLRRTASPTC